MTFFSPVVKVFTLKYAPPHPNLLWDLSESALASECLPDHQNNAMFIPEVSSCVNADHNIIEPDGRNGSLIEEFSPKTENFSDLDIGGRSTTSSTEIQRKFREVDLWLEEQSRNGVLPVARNDYYMDSYNHDDSPDSIPHHLLVQMGLAEATAAAGSDHRLDQYNNNNNSYSQNRVYGEELHRLEDHDFESVDANMKMTGGMSGGFHDGSANYRSISHENSSELSNIDQCDKSVSSLSQLFHDEELNEEDMKEIARSVETINRTVRGTGTIRNRKTELKKKSSYRSENIASSMNVKKITSEIIGHNEAPKEYFSNDSENVTAQRTCHTSVERLDDVGVSQTSLLKLHTIPKILEIPQTPQVKLLSKIVETLETPPKPQILEMATPPLRQTPKILTIMKTPKILTQSPVAETHGTSPLKSTHKVVETINESIPNPSPTITKMKNTAAPKLAIFDCDQKLPSSQTHSKSDNVPPTNGSMFQTSPKNEETTHNYSEPPDSTTRSNPHDSPNNPPNENFSVYPDGRVAVIQENETGEVTVSEQGLPTQSSLSQLFQTQEFTPEYMDTVKCNFQTPEESTANPEKLTSEVISPTPDKEMGSTAELLENARKMNSQPFVIRGNEQKLFDISVKRKEDRPWKKQVTEGVLEPADAVSKRDQKSIEEIPMVVSPYFPNTDNHPVQDDKKTMSSDTLEFSVSQAFDLSQGSQDVLGKILNYDQATDDYQICKNFFSYRSPPQTPRPNLKGDKIKRRKPDEAEGTLKTKKSRISKKGGANNQKITDYFAVVRKVGNVELKAKGHHKNAIKDSSPKLSNIDHFERSSGKFQFEDLPQGSQMKMSNFYLPHTNSTEKRKLSTSAEKRETTTTTTAVAIPPSTHLDQLPRNDPEESQATIQFNCFPRHRSHLHDKDCEVIILEEDKVEEVASSMENSGDLIEIGFTICYRQKYCRLNMPDDGGTCHSPCGIMSRVEFADNKPLFIYQDTSGLHGENGRSFILCLLESKCRKVCFEAQAFIMFVLDALKEQDLRICYDWHLLDPMVGLWLMDPDHPSQNFSLLLSKLDLKVVISESNDWKSTVGRYLSIQSLTIEKLFDKMTDLGLWDVFNRMETPITPILAAMELRSIEVDYSRLRDTSKVLQKKISDVEQEAWKLVGRKFQLSSPVQLRRILYDELKLDEMGSIDIKTTASSKAKSTDEGTLKSLIGLHALPSLILEYRHAHKIKSTYVDGLLSHVVNKRTISTTWEQCAAATGRITSSSPNLQSIPKRDEDLMVAGENFNVRKVFIARPGRKFIAVDFQQIELRTFAHLSKDEQLMSVFKQPGDIFVTMTKMRLGKVDFESTEREKTKTLMYALLYGAGTHKVSDVLSVDEETANRVCGDFYKLFPGLKNYRSSVLEECRVQKKLKSLSGRRRLFPHVTASCIKQKRYTERQAVNFTIQGSAADICKAAMLRTEMALREKGFDASLLLQIHDELLWEVPEDLVPEVKDTITKSIEETSDYWTNKFNLKVPMTVKITTGSSWGSMC